MAKEGWFTVAPGVKLFERHMAPEMPPLAHVVIIHGYGDHCSRYGWVMERFLEAGIASHTYDQRGHGRSPGRRAYVERFETFLDDLDIFLDSIREGLGAVPLFLMGHSMGGMVLARYAQTRKPAVRGLIFSSPFLAFSDEVPALLIALGPIIAKLLPWAPVSRVDNTGLSRDPAILEIADKDPLGYHGRVAAHTAGEFHRMIRVIGENMHSITAPMLVLHGGGDRIVSPSGSRALHERAQSSDKELKIFEGGYHELFNDLDKAAFMEDITRWISARLS